MYKEFFPGLTLGVFWLEAPYFSFYMTVTGCQDLSLHVGKAAVSPTVNLAFIAKVMRSLDSVT